MNEKQTTREARIARNLFHETEEVKPKYYTTTQKALISLAYIIFYILFVIICGSLGADDTALTGKITRVSYTKPTVNILQLQLLALREAGLELSWDQPNPEDGKWIWVKYEGLPWIRVHAWASDDENEVLRYVLKL